MFLEIYFNEILVFLECRNCILNWTIFIEKNMNLLKVLICDSYKYITNFMKGTGFLRKGCLIGNLHVLSIDEEGDLLLAGKSIKSIVFVL
jgi:hypothetical protein